MCNWVCGKGIPDRDKGALHTFGWLDLYASAKQEEAEALYNMGRAAHQMGLLSGERTHGTWVAVASRCEKARLDFTCCETHA